MASRRDNADLEAWRVPPDIDMTKAHTARMYDYLLGGKDHFKADREAMSGLLRPCLPRAPGPGRIAAFLGRAVRYLASSTRPRSSSSSTSSPYDREQRPRGGATASPPRAVSCTWTTTRSCWRTPGHCSPAPGGPDRYIQQICATRTRSCVIRRCAAKHSTSASRQRTLMLVAVLHFFQDDPGPIIVSACCAVPAEQLPGCLAHHRRLQRSQRGGKRRPGGAERLAFR